jgi:hypothetical protein
MNDKSMSDGIEGRRERNIFIQFFRFIALNIKIFMMTKHKH